MRSWYTCIVALLIGGNVHAISTANLDSIDVTTLTPAQLLRTTPHLVLVYDESTEEYFSENYTTSSVTEINNAMLDVNRTLANSGSELRFTWQVVKNPDRFDTELGIGTLESSDWYQSFFTAQSADLVLAIYNPDAGIAVSNRCIAGLVYDSNGLSQTPEKQNELATCHVSARTLGEHETSLAHQIGHYFALNHDRRQVELEGKSQYDDTLPYGYFDAETGAYSIMALPATCTEAGLEKCEQLPLFSNPELIHNGSHLGSTDTSTSANGAKFLSYAGKDMVTDYWDPVSMSINVTDSTLTIEWQDVAAQYLITKSYYTESGIHEEFVIDEPSLSVTRKLYDKFADDDDDEGGLYYPSEQITVYGLYSNNDVVRAVWLGEVQTRKIVKDYASDILSASELRDAQIGISEKTLQLPPQGESVTVTLQLPESEADTPNDHFYFVSKWAACLEAEANQFGNCDTSMAGDYNPLDRSFTESTLYRDRDPAWLSQFFDISLSGDGTERTLTLTSLMDQEQWKDYFLSITDDTYSNSSRETEEFQVFRTRTLPFQAVYYTDTAAGDDGNYRLHGGVVLEVDLQPLFDESPLLAGTQFTSAPSLTLGNSPSALGLLSGDDLKLQLAAQGTDTSGWSVSFNNDSGLSILTDSVTDYHITASELTAGYHHIVAQVSASDNSPVLSPINQSGNLMSVSFTAVESLPELSSETDSDGDGLSDFSEGLADTNDNGILDYLDPADRPMRNMPVFDEEVMLLNTASVTVPDTDNSVFAKDAYLALPGWLRAASNGLATQASFDFDAFQQYWGDLAILEKRQSAVTDAFSVLIKDPQIMLAKAAVVVPLPNLKELDSTMHLLYFSEESGWQNYDQRQGLKVYSFPAQDDACVYSQSAARTGLISGYQCLYMEYTLGDMVSELDLGSFALIAETPNSLPQLDFTSGISLRESSSQKIALTVTDADDDEVSLSAVAHNSDLLIVTSSNLESIDLSALLVDEDTETTIKVTLNDGFDETVVDIPVTILNNQLPTVAVEGTTSLRESESLTLGLTIADAEGDKVVINALSDNEDLISVESVNMEQVVIKAKSVSEDGSAVIKLNLNDGYEDTTIEIPVTVLNNQAPVVEVSGTSVEESESVTLSATVSDPESDPVSIQWVQTAGPDVTLDDVQSATITFTAPAVSEDTTLSFEISVFDGLDTTTQSVDVTVTNQVEASPAPPSSGGSSSGSGGGATLYLLLFLAIGLFHKAVRQRRLH